MAKKMRPAPLTPDGGVIMLLAAGRLGPELSGTKHPTGVTRKVAEAYGVL